MKKITNGFGFEDILYRSGILSFLHLIPFRFPKTCVLAFHDIPASQHKAFGRFIDYLLQYYPFVTPQNFAVGKLDATWKKPHILLTFDDCFVSNYHIAKNILEPKGIKAIFFAPTKFVGLEAPGDYKGYIAKNLYNNRLAPSEIPDTMAPMSWNQLRELRLSGHVIGGHTAQHKNLALLQDKTRLFDEIVAAGDELEEKLDSKIDFFATPFGRIDNINQAALNIIAKRYTHCFSSVRGVNTPQSHPLAILRETIAIENSVLYNSILVAGGLRQRYAKRAEALQRMAEAATSRD